MKHKLVLLYWVDVLIGVLFAGLVFTGSILRWVLPPGSGGGGGGHGWRGGRGPASIQTFWDMTRHEWGDIHFWIAAALVAGILIHLLLHWNWIVAATRKVLVQPLSALRKLAHS